MTADLDVAMRAAGWMPSRIAPNDILERPAAPPFALRAQLWTDGPEVEVELTMECDAAAWALHQLGEDGAARRQVTCDPLDGAVTIERPGQIAELVREIGAAADRMQRYADVDAFLGALAEDDRALVAPVLLAVAGRDDEARERAAQVPGDFPERFAGWLAGDRTPPPRSGEPFPWRDALKDAVRRARERREEPPEVRAARPQASWGDVARSGRVLSRLLKGEFPPSGVVPDPKRPWELVELAPGAAPVLARAREASGLRLLQGAFVEARLAPGESGRLRVLLDGTEVGAVAGTAPATVVGRIHRHRPGAPLELSVQLPAG